ncbi:AAA family ATPase [Patulibacter defluvii]|uniref:AAA family ATPase n=1 Tax=Patulibacter defluvii TaxID=3095358 RepID=UPI002A761608|nr:AAA family ATPase [Patulibacter sp. DM4]
MVHRSARERRAMLREIRERADGVEPLVRTVRLPAEVGDERLDHAAAVPAVQALREGLELDPAVTFLVGENGAGKSTVVEAIAVAAGLNPEGGSSQLQLTTRASHSPLGEQLLLVRGARRPRTDFFLRAESVFTVATELDRLAEEPYAGDVLGPYGGVSLHARSHGESFLAIATHRFGPDGFYVLDEPEAALSAQNQLTLLRRIHELVRARSQFVIATHSPLLLAYPGARILLCDEHGLRPIAYDDAPSVALTRGFLGAPERFVERLLAED